MTSEAKIMCGVTLIAVPTIEWGGYFLLRVLTGTLTKQYFTEFQKAMFRAGHAHAGVLVLLSLVCQVLADHAGLDAGLEWLVRLGIPFSAILICGGFFGAAAKPGTTKPTFLIWLVYGGALLLGIAVFILGVGLIGNS